MVARTALLSPASFGTPYSLSWRHATGTDVRQGRKRVAASDGAVTDVHARRGPVEGLGGDKARFQGAGKHEVKRGTLTCIFAYVARRVVGTAGGRDFRRHRNRLFREEQDKRTAAVAALHRNSGSCCSDSHGH